MADNDNAIEEDANDALDYAQGNDQEGGVFRWMSFIVVLLAVAGFFGLAWYAYKSGGEVVDEKDVELILADKTLIKEEPTNPGGMPIPNQDKTVYGLVAGKSENAKVVEHILASPETPVVREGDESETGTWMSDQVKDKIKSDQDTNGDAALPDAVPSESLKNHEKITEKPEAKVAQFKPIKAPLDIKELKLGESSVTSVAKEVKPDEAVAPVIDSSTPLISDPTKTETAKEELKPSVVEKETDKPSKEVVVSEDPKKVDNNAEQTTSAIVASNARAQLGAFKSEEEAEGQWKKIVKKFATEVRGKEHYVVRADLGAKGVYYRLQLAPFESAKEVERFCLELVSDGQGCFAAKGK